MTPTAAAYLNSSPQTSQTNKLSRCRLCDGSGWRLLSFRGNAAVTQCKCRGGRRVLVGARDFKSAAAGDRP